MPATTGPPGEPGRRPGEAMVTGAAGPSPWDGSPGAMPLPAPLAEPGWTVAAGGVAEPLPWPGQPSPAWRGSRPPAGPEPARPGLAGREPVAPAPARWPGPPGRPAAGTGATWRQVFPGEQGQLGAVRRWVASLLPDCPARDDVVSVATELASNAIKHTASGRGGRFAVEVARDAGPGVVRLAVADGGAPDGPRRIDDPSGEHGRGLLLVSRLSVRRGVAGDHRGRVVWADIPWAGPGGAAAPAGDLDEAVIAAGQAELARRFAGVPCWFGRSTLRWWALVELPSGGELVTARSAAELASMLDGILAARTAAQRLPGSSGRPAQPGRAARRAGALAGGPQPFRRPVTAARQAS
jgi:anti-sigma regulatory factor (Ser/Thr protein kinase)